MRKVTCIICNRKVNAQVVKAYSVQEKGDSNQFINREKLVLSDHKTSIFGGQKCSNSGRKINKTVGGFNLQN